MVPNLLSHYKSIVSLKQHLFIDGLYGIAYTVRDIVSNIAYMITAYLYVLPLGMVLVTCSIHRLYIFATSLSFHFSSCPSQSRLEQISCFIRRPGIMNLGIQRIRTLKGNFPTSGTLPNFSMKMVSRTFMGFQIDDFDLICDQPA